VFVTTDYPFGGGGQIVRVNRSNRSNRQTAECMRGASSAKLSHLRFHVCLDYTKQHG
jgi:hypothetical protein